MMNKLKFGLLVTFSVAQSFQSALSQVCISDPVEVGFQTFNYGTNVTPEPTETKPESKLWFNDGSWWGILWSPGNSEFRIHRFDKSNQCWIDVGAAADERGLTSADALWDGVNLYIASHAKMEFTGAGDDARLYKTIPTILIPFLKN